MVKDKEPWEKQHDEKYRNHDLPLDQISERDLDMIRGSAVTSFIETRESDNVKLIIAAFMGFLVSKGYRIVKKEVL